MSGTLKIQRGDLAPIVVLKNTGVTVDTSSNNHVTNALTPGLNILDSADNFYGLFKSEANTEGRVETYITARNKTAEGNWISNILSAQVAKDGTKSYSVSDPAAFRNAIEAVNKAGDKMTGSLTMTKTTHIQSSVLDRDGTALTSETTSPWLQVSDKDGERLGVFRSLYAANSTDNRIQIGAFNEKTDSTEVVNLFQVIAKRDGTQTYQVSNAANFRSAIGAAASSDRRLKSNITPLGQDAVDFTMALKPCSYIINGENQVGLIAQDVAEADTWNTHMAFETTEGIDGLDDWEKMGDGSPTWKLDYIRIIPPLVATVQAQQKKIEELESKIN